MNLEVNFDRIKKRRETKRKKRKVEIKFLIFFSDNGQNGGTESNWRLLKTESLVTYIEVSDSEARRGQRRRRRQWHVRTHCLFYRSNTDPVNVISLVVLVTHRNKSESILGAYEVGGIERNGRKDTKKKTLINKQNFHTTRLRLSFKSCISTFRLCLIEKQTFTTCLLFHCFGRVVHVLCDRTGCRNFPESFGRGEVTESQQTRTNWHLITSRSLHSPWTTLKPILLPTNDI